MLVDTIALSVNTIALSADTIALSVDTIALLVDTIKLQDDYQDLRTCTVTLYLSLCQLSVIKGVKAGISRVQTRISTENLQAVSTQIVASLKGVKPSLMTRIYFNPI
ncbi:hypothetical protein [uncultured Nostoc sp.]|uniref:hypothetical protein n=1 Tax=uncultured Nostoc sp. TaxID=340711 RepID=UPI0026265CE6|nr:hypothetical protein [uncultured Nostoc sp.]